jgi:hypothetical protein
MAKAAPTTKLYNAQLSNGQTIQVWSDSEENVKKHFEDKRVAKNSGHNSVIAISEAEKV